MEFYECSDVTVNGITLVNSPMWNLVLRYSSNITVTNYHVQNYSDPANTIPAPTIGPNTDGIDPVGSSFLTISNIFVQVGDDDVAIKSGLPTDVVSGIQLPPGSDPNQIGLPTMPSHDITITNANITGGHGISIGSEASNGVYNVSIQNINANGSSLTEGLRIKTGRTRGNYAIGIHDITINNMIATDVVQPILIYGYYPAGGPPNETGSTDTVYFDHHDKLHRSAAGDPAIHAKCLQYLHLGPDGDRSNAVEHHRRGAGILHSEREPQQREHPVKCSRTRWRERHVPTAEHDRNLQQREYDLHALAADPRMGRAGERAGDRHRHAWV